MLAVEEGIELSDIDVLSLRHDLINFEEWIRDAVKGKIAACQSRLIDEWTPKLLDDPNIEVLPASKDELILLITEHPCYLNRVDREALNGSTIN